MMIRSGNENESGKTLALSAVTKVPLRAAIAAPKAKLMSFSELTGIPITSAASGVLAQRPPGTARPREVDEAQRDVDDHEHGQDDVHVGGVEDPPLRDGQLAAEEAEWVDVEEPVRAAGDVVTEQVVAVRRHGEEELEEEEA